MYATAPHANKSPSYILSLQGKVAERTLVSRMRLGSWLTDWGSKDTVHGNRECMATRRLLHRVATVLWYAPDV